MTCDITEKNHALAELENYVSGLLPTDIVPFKKRESVFLFSVDGKTVPGFAEGDAARHCDWTVSCEILAENSEGSSPVFQGITVCRHNDDVSVSEYRRTIRGEMKERLVRVMSFAALVEALSGILKKRQDFLAAFGVVTSKTGECSAAFAQ